MSIILCEVYIFIHLQVYLIKGFIVRNYRTLIGSLDMNNFVKLVHSQIKFIVPPALEFIDKTVFSKDE